MHHGLRLPVNWLKRFNRLHIRNTPTAGVERMKPPALELPERFRVSKLKAHILCYKYVKNTVVLTLKAKINGIKPFLAELHPALHFGTLQRSLYPLIRYIGDLTYSIPFPRRL